MSSTQIWITGGEATSTLEGRHVEKAEVLRRRRSGGDTTTDEAEELWRRDEELGGVRMRQRSYGGVDLEEARGGGGAQQVD